MALTFTDAEKDIIMNFINVSLSQQSPQAIADVFAGIIENDADTLAFIRSNFEAFINGIKAKNTAEISGLDAVKTARQTELTASNTMMDGILGKVYKQLQQP